MLLSFITSDAFIIAMTCLIFFITFLGITLYRNYKEDNKSNVEEIKEDESI